MHEGEFVNGINVTRLRNVIETVKRDAEPAKFKFGAHNEWVDGSHAFSEIKDFCAGGSEDTTRPYRFVFHADEPDALLGTNYGPNPVETVMHALCCCVGSALVFNAAMQGVKLDTLEFDVEGDIDVRGFLAVAPDVRKGLQSIRMNCRISGDAPQSKLDELVKLGQQYSPVFDIVSHGVPVTVSVEGQEVKAAM